MSIYQLTLISIHGIQWEKLCHMVDAFVNTLRSMGKDECHTVDLSMVKYDCQPMNAYVNTFEVNWKR
jgi:hypothetical protein